MREDEKEKREKEIKMQQKAVDDRLANIKHKIMVISGKGGVGKTTVAVNLALTFAMHGIDVGLMDADIHGPNVPKMLGIEDMQPSANPDGNGIYPVMVPPRVKVMSIAFLLSSRDSPVIWRGPMKMNAIRQFLSDVIWGNMDYLIVDLPPGTGDEPLSVAQLIPKMDGAIVVTTPQDISLLDSRKAVNFTRQLKMPVIGIVENMSGFSCPYCGKEIDLFKIGGGERAAVEMGVPFLGRIPIDPKIVEDGDSGTPFVLERNSAAAEAFDGIVKNIKEFVNKKEVK
jgi:Mrp family chromosome partitioning ATPase